MSSFSLLTSFLSKELPNSQSILSDAIKSLLYKHSPHCFDLLEFDDDEIYLEPLLFTFLSGSDISYSIDQILFGYIQPEVRPKKIKVKVEKDGYVYLPKIGFFYLDVKADSVELHYSNNEFYFSHKNQTLNHDFKCTEFLKGTKIEILRHKITPHTNFYRNAETDAIEDVQIQRITSLKIDELNKALDVNKTLFNEHFNLISQVGRRAVIFENHQVRSFAAKPVHGTAFFSTWENNFDIFFFVELAHQFGHNILNSVTTQSEDYFKIDINTPLKELNGDPNESRTFFNAFHGLHVTAMIGTYLEYLYDSNYYSGLKLHEISARLSDNQTRHLTGLERTNPKKIFTNKGLELYELLDNSCHEILKRKEDLIKEFYVPNTPFVFDFDLFLRHYPFQ